MSKHVTTKRLHHIGQFLKRSKTKRRSTRNERSSKLGSQLRNDRKVQNDNSMTDSNELAEYHVVRDDCKVVVNNEGRHVLECIETERAPWHFGLLEPIHDAAKWLEAHTPDQHYFTGADHYRKLVIDNKRN